MFGVGKIFKIVFNIKNVLNDFSCAHQGCIYSIKNTVLTVNVIYSCDGKVSLLLSKVSMLFKYFPVQ